MKFVAITRFAVLSTLLICGLESANAGEKIKFSVQTNQLRAPFELNPIRNQKEFDPSLNPSVIPSGDPTSIPFMLPPRAPASRVPNSKEKDKTALDKDWIFKTHESATESAEANEEEYSPEKALGIKDYLLTKASDRDGVRNYVQENGKNEESTLRNRSDYDSDEDEEDEWDSKNFDAKKKEKASESTIPETYSLGSSLQEKNAQGSERFETRSSFRTLLSVPGSEQTLEAKNEQKQQMNDFKGLLRPSAGGSKILFDNLNPDATPRNFGGDSSGPNFFRSLASEGPVFQNPFAPRQSVAPAPAAISPAFQPTPAPVASGSRGDVFGSGSGAARAQAKPAVLPFPKRPGSY